MNLNLSCLLFWITYLLILLILTQIIPHSLISFTYIHVIIILIVTNLCFIIFKVGCPVRFLSNQTQTQEHFLNPCEKCDNPYDINHLKSMIIGTDLEPTTKTTSTLKIKRKLPLCQALVESGFDSKWNYNDVHNLLKTKVGQQTLQQINNETLKLTQLNQLTNLDINQCYPHYLTEYSYVQPNQNEIKQLIQTINKQQRELNQLKTSNN